MRILSLFDGMACGMIAMQLAGVEVESYDAYEIDKYAIKTAQHNFPMIEEHGDVFKADFTQYEGVDFLVGGSPCTYWSIAQTKNRETVASGMGWELFSQYVRALKEAKPKYFIYENNKSMSKQIRASIDDTFGFEAVLINSALVSAQNRQRLYWVGRRNEDGTYSKVNVEQPEDRGILLKDALDSGTVDRDKSLVLTARYAGFDGSQSYLCRRYFGKSFGQAAFDGDIGGMKSKWEENAYFESDEKNIRQLTVSECKRLQTVPEWYDFSVVSNSQAYKMLGNGWTCEVIAHLIRSCLNDDGSQLPGQISLF
ncbi:MAG: DNA cytosine methyltransferase [Prevotellaceae bacterium]|nr:DNA cytosine methyltransferase [Candidatus Colivivens caballi]